MLEVIKSDFERQLRQTSDAEAAAHRDFVNFDRQSKVSIAEKETGKEQAETDLESTKVALSEGFTDLEDIINSLIDWSTSELNTQLNPTTCLGDTGCCFQQVTAPTLVVTC